MKQERSSEHTGKKVLAINFFPAFTPPRSGGELRYYHLYRFLRHYYDINMVNPTELFGKEEEIRHFDNMTEHRIPKKKVHLNLHRIFDRIGRFKECSAAVVMLASRWDKSLKEKIEFLRNDADLVIHECPFMYHMAPKKEGQFLAYDSYNVEYDLMRDILKGAVGRYLCRLIFRLEGRACRESDIVFATSEADRQRLSLLYNVSPRKIVIIPNGVDPEEITPPTEEERNQAREKLGLTERAAALFFGSAHPPNIKAVEFIISRLAPEVPYADFLIAGSVSAHFQNHNPPSNVRLLGKVEDDVKISLLKGSDIALNPMFSGSGSNLKMFDYLSAGLPVITTPVGGRGIPLGHYIHAIIEEPENMLPALTYLISNTELQIKLTQEGRKLVEEKFHWKNLAFDMHRAMEECYQPSVTVINDFPVLPPLHGGQYRIMSLYSELSEKMPVHYLCMQRETDEMEELQIRDNFIQYSIPKSLLHRVAESLTGRLFDFSLDDILSIYFAHRNKILRREIKEGARGNDILICVHPYMWRAFKKHKKNFRIYESLNYETMLKKASLKGMFGSFLVNKVRWIEKKAVRESDMVLTVSDQEGKAFEEDFRLEGSWKTIPNGTDTSRITIPSKEVKTGLRHYLNLPESPIALFIGSAHPPNVQAGRHLIKDIAPRTPDVLYFIIGSVCWILKNEQPPPNVKLFFEVDEIIRNDLFKVADIAVNPMTSGAGTSLKMFDYMAAGLPIISTPLGARGAACENCNYMIMAKVEEFPEKIKKIFENPERLRKLVKEARKKVEKEFDWTVISERLYKILKSLLKDETVE